MAHLSLNIQYILNLINIQKVQKIYIRKGRHVRNYNIKIKLKNDLRFS